MTEEAKNPKYLVDAYQHIADGGLSVAVKTETDSHGNESHALEITLSNYGVRQTTTIPVFAATPNILRIIADELEAKNIVDPKYLHPIITHVTFAEKKERYFRFRNGKVQEVGYDDCYGSSGQAQQTAQKE